MQKVMLYVDGYNLYYAIKRQAAARRHPIGLGWCDFERLAEQHMLYHGEILVGVRYFTAPVGDTGIGDESARQSLWLDAVQTLRRVTVVKGFYMKPDDKPRKEKQTDVNIAVQLLLDAMHRRYDRAILISADHDLAPAVSAVRREFARRISIFTPLTPPSKTWLEFGVTEQVECAELTPAMLKNSRLPDVIRKDGRVIRNRSQWKIPGDS